MLRCAASIAIDAEKKGGDHFAMEEQRSCSTCTHYLSSSWHTEGVCRRYPKTAMNEVLSFYPRHHPTDVCGEHKTEAEALRARVAASSVELALVGPKDPPPDCPCGCDGDWFRHGVGDPFDEPRKEPVVDKELTEVTEGYLEPEEETPKSEGEVRVTGSEEAMNRGKRGRRGKK